MEVHYFRWTKNTPVSVVLLFSLPMFSDAMFQQDTSVVTGIFKILGRVRKKIRYNHRSPSPTPTANHYRIIATGTQKEWNRRAIFDDEKLYNHSFILILYSNRGRKCQISPGKTRHTLLWTVMTRSSPVKSPRLLGCRGLQMYCTCRTPYHWEFMIGYESCGEWFHDVCVVVAALTGGWWSGEDEYNIGRNIATSCSRGLEVTNLSIYEFLNSPVMRKGIEWRECMATIIMFMLFL